MFIMPLPLKSLFSSYFAVRCAEVALVVALLLALADLARLLFPSLLGGAGDPDGRAAVAVADPAPQSGALPATRHAASTRLSPALLGLFGRAETAANVPADAGYQGEELKETKLDLTLKGILAHRDSNRRLALIAGADEKEDVYWVGDRVAGAQIIRIEARRAVLLHDGVREALTLETKIPRPRQDTSAHGAGARGSLAGKPRRGEGNGAARAGPARAGITALNEYERVVDRDLLDRQLDNLPELLTQARVAPHRNPDGEQVGYRVVGIQAGSVFEDLGIRPEDVIVGINGASVRSNREAFAAWRSFRSASAFQLDVLRDGREVTLDLSVH